MTNQELIDELKKLPPDLPAMLTYAEGLSLKYSKVGMVSIESLISNFGEDKDKEIKAVVVG